LDHLIKISSPRERTLRFFGYGKDSEERLNESTGENQSVCRGRGMGGREREREVGGRCDCSPAVQYYFYALRQWSERKMTKMPSVSVHASRLQLSLTHIAAPPESVNGRAQGYVTQSSQCTPNIKPHQESTLH